MQNLEKAGAETPGGHSPFESARKLRWAVVLLVVSLGLLATELWHSFTHPSFNGEQKALLAWEGARAPDFSVTNLDGQISRLGDLKGKRVFVNFWATWCAPCLEEIPDFVKLRAGTSPTNVVILGLSTDDAATQATFAQRNRVNYPLATLQNMPSPYQDIILIPATLVIDRRGVIQHILFGPQELKTLQPLAAEADFAGTIKPAPAAQNPP